MILYPNLTILVNFEIPKLLVKISGTFLVRRYEKEKSQIILKLSNKSSGKTNVPTHTAQLKEILKNDSRR